MFTPELIEQYRLLALIRSISHWSNWLKSEVLTELHNRGVTGYHILCYLTHFDLVSNTSISDKEARELKLAQITWKERDRAGYDIFTNGEQVARCTQHEKLPEVPGLCTVTKTDMAQVALLGDTDFAFLVSNAKKIIEEDGKSSLLAFLRVAGATSFAKSLHEASITTVSELRTISSELEIENCNIPPLALIYLRRMVGPSNTAAFRLLGKMLREQSITGLVGPDVVFDNSITNITKEHEI